ncbi:hypothetical protein MYX78_05160 [Acidobacteria bacterium AH-259-G07]|nr:hypothetical protein [Acidobacteria bacterium AH-259-G07]
MHCCQVAEDSDRQEFLKLGPAAGLYLADQVVDLEQLYPHYLQEGGQSLEATPDWRADGMPRGV